MNPGPETEGVEDPGCQIWGLNPPNWSLGRGSYTKVRAGGRVGLKTRRRRLEPAQHHRRPGRRTRKAMRPFKSRIQGTALTALQVPELPQGVAIEAARCPRTPSSCRPKGNKQPLRLPQILMPAHSHAGLLQIPINRSGVGLGICIFNSPPHHHQKASWALWRNNSRSQPGR